MFSPIGIVIVSLFIVHVKCFSYNVNARTVFSPANSNDHSYFGYTVLLRGGESPLLIVGAPQDSSNLPAYTKIKDPGAIYFCRLNSTDNKCYQKTLDIEGNTRKNAANGLSYHHRKDNMWLGMSIDGSTNNNGTLIMCAPRWSNQLHENFYLGNGMCYTIPNTVRPFESSNVNILTPLVEQYRQGYAMENELLRQVYGNSSYFYAYGEAGMSLKISDDGKEALMGAPGVFVWTGSVIRYKIAKQRGFSDYFMLQIIPNPYYTPTLKDASYFGYSVGIGKFLSTSETSYYLAGAPRGADLKGEVFLFNYPIRENDRINIIKTFEGKQLGEYFGSVISTIDINQDGLPDLLVGAPLYSEPFMWDQGRVYVYMNHDKFNFLEQESKICGSFREGSRFGSTIAEIGDINGDGFTDVAIGAPYEEYENGAVYIYLGASNGLNPMYSQRITIGNLKGFGISISKGVDIDNNSCNDIVVGAYTSAKAVLLRCHPSISLKPKIDTNPSELSLNITTFSAEICLKFIGRTSRSIEIALKVLVDPDYKRARLTNPSDSSLILKGFGDSESCKVVEIDIESKKADLSLPLKLNITYDLKENPLHDAKFCVDCVVLKPFEKRSLEIEIPFATGCAEKICRPDLKLHVDILNEAPFTIGSNSSISLNVSIENIGEPAFLTKAKLIQPIRAPLLKVPSQCQLNDMELTCDYENPLKNSEKKYILLEFDTSSLTSYDSLLVFNVSCYSGGEEVTPDDNNFIAILPLNAISKIQVIGSSTDSEYLSIESKNVSINHTFDILNEGPSSVEDFSIMIYIPTSFQNNSTDSNHALVSVYEPIVQMNTENLICNLITGSYIGDERSGYSFDFTNDTDDSSSFTTTESPVYETTTVLEKRKILSEMDNDLNNFMESRERVKFTNTLYLNCTDKDRVKCVAIQCSGYNFSPKINGIHISLKLKLNASGFEEVLRDKYITSLSTFVVFNKNQNDTIHKSFGHIYSYIIGPDSPISSTPIWIYIVSLALGLTLLALISLGLYKYGFFRRKTKEELELLKNQEQDSADLSVSSGDK